MKDMKILMVIFLLFHLNASAQVGKIIQTNIAAPSLGNSMFDDITLQSIIIYLPPSYDTSKINYPVVYFLPGFSTPNTDFLNGSFQGYILNKSMDDLIKQGKIKEMIVVIPNSLTFMLGSFYFNSTVRGNWEDYIVDDLVDYIDNNYRTISNANSRGIAGHSMGGFGALNLAMRHPDIYCATYGLSPGLFDKNGLKDQGMFSQSMMNQFLAKQEEWSKMDKYNAMAAFKEYINYLKSISDNNTVLSYAYGAAFSPNPVNYPTYIAYPYFKQGGQILCDSTVLRNYENGFGGLAEKVSLYKQNLLNLKGIIIDYGKYDSYTWIRNGSVYFSQLLDDADIPHDLLSFNGGHGDMVKSRIENYVMPFYSKTLTFDTLNSSVNTKGNMFNPSDFYLTNYPNPFNSSTTIVFNLPVTCFVVLNVYNLYGQKVETLIKGVYFEGEYKLKWHADILPSGVYFYRLQVGEFFETKKLILQK